VRAITSCCRLGLVIHPGKEKEWEGYQLRRCTRLMGLLCGKAAEEHTMKEKESRAMPLTFHARA